MGRKKLDTPKDVWLVVRATRGERDAVKDAAHAAGLTLSAYVLRQCLPPEQSPRNTADAPPT